MSKKLIMPFINDVYNKFRGIPHLVPKSVGKTNTRGSIIVALPNKLGAGIAS